MEINIPEAIRLYTIELKSTHFIAKKYNTYPNKIRRILVDNGESIRDKSAAQAASLETGAAKHPTKGRKRSYEEKLKISSKLMDYWDDMSDTEKQRRSEQAKEHWDSLSEESKANMRSLANQALKTAAGAGSKFENFIFRTLSDAGHDAEQHKKDLLYNEKLEIDLYIRDLKTIIEVDGPSHFFPVWGEEKLQKQVRADMDKNGLVLSKGFVMIRIKAMKNNLSIKDQHVLSSSLLSTLNNIKNAFPTRQERFIEIEL